MTCAIFVHQKIVFYLSSHPMAASEHCLFSLLGSFQNGMFNRKLPGKRFPHGTALVLFTMLSMPLSSSWAKSVVICYSFRRKMCLGVYPELCLLGVAMLLNTGTVSINIR